MLTVVVSANLNELFHRRLEHGDLCYTQPSNTTPQQYTDGIVAKLWKVADIYFKETINNIFYQRAWCLHRSLIQSTVTLLGTEPTRNFNWHGISGKMLSFRSEKSRQYHVHKQTDYNLVKAFDGKVSKSQNSASNVIIITISSYQSSWYRSKLQLALHIQTPNATTMISLASSSSSSIAKIDLFFCAVWIEPFHLFVRWPFVTQDSIMQFEKFGTKEIDKCAREKTSRRTKVHQTNTTTDSAVIQKRHPYRKWTLMSLRRSRMRFHPRKTKVWWPQNECFQWKISSKQYI